MKNKDRIWNWAYIDLDGSPCLSKEKMVSLMEYRRMEKRLKKAIEYLRHMNVCAVCAEGLKYCDTGREILAFLPPLPEKEKK